MIRTMRLRGILAAALAAAAILTSGDAAAKDLLGVACTTPPPQHCSGADCAGPLIGETGAAVDPKTGRRFFLDYPCDLKPGEKVIFILSIHGAGSIGNWQRHYFPAMDYKDKYRLVIATPTAATSASIFAGAPAVRMWQSDADDAHLQNIVQLVFGAVGQQNIKAFWLAGHSQGGMTSNRIVCSDFFKDKVDGWLSLSGGRIGPAQVPAGFGPARPAGEAAPTSGPRPGAAFAPACGFNYIFETGEKEIVALPDASPWAEKYRCGARVRRADVVDDKPGWVTGARPGPPNPAWGREARPGTAEVFVYPNCKGGRLVADVERLDKGHTEGLEPKVTEALIKMIVAAPAGKLRGGPASAD